MSTRPDAEWVKVGGTIPHEVFTKPISKSELDNREYRFIRLPNSLEALLISDPETDKAAAALDVSVGHLSDPDDLPGCAHFCEHLLFMGTKEFPSENEYSQFISSHGGSTNAYTSAHNTNYYFSVSHTSLDGALARFSAFFKSPLFSPSCTGREINAVDSEHKKNLQNDTWRMFQVSKFLSRADHPWRKFGSGNRASLLAVGKALEEQERKKGAALETKVNGDAMDVDKPDLLRPDAGDAQMVLSRSPSPLPDDDGGIAGRETRRRLVEWWEQQYCSSRMKLVILGKESLDDLNELAVRYFTEVPNRGLPPPPVYPSSTFGPEHQGVIAYAKTVMDFKALEIGWNIPWQPPLYSIKPGNFVSHFIGHEGPGSLHSYLKQKGWITYLSAGPSTGAPGFDFFKVTIVLTKEGFENHVEVLRALYSYIALLRNSSSAELYESQQEIIKLSNIFFRFREKASSASNYVSRLAERSAHPYPKDKILSAPTVVEDWDEGLIRNLFEKHITPEQGRVLVMAREGWDKVTLVDESVPNKEARHWEKEKWYGTEYFVRRIPVEILKQAEGPNSIPELVLPKKNLFVPDNLEVEKKAIDAPLKRPLKIRETPMSTLWYKKDDQFWVPKANVDILIVSPLAAATPRQNVATRMIVDLIRDALTEYAYDAELTGLAYEVNIVAEGIAIVVSGYNDKLLVLLEVVLDKVKNLEIKADRFTVLKEQLRQEYENQAMEQPYHISDYYARYLLSPSAWTAKEKLSELEVLSVEDTSRHLTELLSRVYIRALVHGNMRKDEAHGVVKLAENIIGGRSLTPVELNPERTLLLPPSSNFIFEIPVPNKNDLNSALTYYVDVGDIADPRTRTVLGLFAHIASEPAFNQLRTVEQLGYIVSSSNWGSTGSIGWRLVIQSEKNPIFLENRVDSFLDTILRPMLETMPDEVFEQKRKSLIQKKLEKFKNLADETQSFWVHITSGYHDFMRRAIDAEELANVTRQDVLNLFMEKIHPSSRARSKLSVHLRSQEAPSPKFSMSAAVELLPILKSRGISIKEDQYLTMSTVEPTVREVKRFWSDHFKTLPDLSPDTAQFLLASIDRCSKDHPSPNNNPDDGRLDGGYKHIHDVAAFKASLAASKGAIPVEMYADFDSRL